FVELHPNRWAPFRAERDAQAILAGADPPDWVVLVSGSERILPSQWVRLCTWREPPHVDVEVRLLKYSRAYPDSIERSVLARWKTEVGDELPARLVRLLEEIGPVPFRTSTSTGTAGALAGSRSYGETAADSR